MINLSGSRKLKLAASLSALILCSACGGGGGGSSSDSSSSNSTPVNRAPVISTNSKSVITEGQPFELDASDSSDRDGDSLTYSWRQVSGPAIAIASATDAKLSLTAPMLDADETVAFEVSVTDGALTTTSTVTLDVEDVKTSVAISESTEFGTGGPQIPSQTVPDPSVFEGRKPLDQIIGLTPSEQGDYTVHWTASGGGHDMPVSSQTFSADGEKVGAQVDGVFLGGDQGTFERDGRTFNRFIFGVTFATVQSGDTLYNLNGLIEFSPNFTIGYNSYRGLVEGEIDGFGDEMIAQAEFSLVNQRVMGGDFTPIGQDSVLLTQSERTTDAVDDPEAKVVMTSYVVDKFGQTLMHELGQYDSNGTARLNNQMTATSYGGDSYFAAWSQNTVEAGYDVRMQRATEGGVLVGAQTTVNATTAGDQLNPFAVTMADGNIFVAWLNLTGSEEANGEIRARIIRPDGSFVTDEIILGPSIVRDINQTDRNGPFFVLTALNTNEVLVTWEETVGGAAEIRSMAFDAELQAVSNEIFVASGEEAENIYGFKTIVLPDNRVIMGWHNNHPFGEDRPDTSHTVGFYPVGKD